MKIDKIYVITIDHSQQNYDSINGRLNLLCLPPTEYQIVEGVNGRDQLSTPEDRKELGVETYSGWKMEDELVRAEESGDELVRGSLPRLNIDIKTETRQATEGPAKIRYLETGISSLCNMACVMCGPYASSTIHSIEFPKKKIPKGFHESNDNIDEDLSELRYLKFVGGEPMLEHKHDDLLEKVMKKNNIEFRRGNAGGGNQLRQPYLKKYVKNICWTESSSYNFCWFLNLL